ncbi:MAG: hypothetical protein JST86_06760 [Bacteroidetes bacterium]|nr:hypothetical protein [Bacteroidota bacterium]
MMFINKFHLLFIVITVQTVQAQVKEFTQDRIPAKSIYTVAEGRLSGKYQSFYLNGKRKAEGELINGYRNGKWTVWDSLGNKRMERVYENPFEFERIWPPVPKNKLVQLLIKNKYPLQYDSNGIVLYAKIFANNVNWRHKFWRILTPDHNEQLFSNNRLYHLLCNWIQQNKLSVYNPVDDRFSTVFSTMQSDSLVKLYRKKKPFAYELKEEVFFDMERLVSEKRILGICPLIKNGADTMRLFWVYYPDARILLGKEAVSNNAGNTQVKSLDDLFIFRQFSSTIIKSTFDNPYDLPLNKYYFYYAESLKKEQEALELIIIEAENDRWLDLTN